MQVAAGSIPPNNHHFPTFGGTVQAAATCFLQVEAAEIYVKALFRGTHSLAFTSEYILYWLFRGTKGKLWQAIYLRIAATPRLSEVSYRPSPLAFSRWRQPKSIQRLISVVPAPEHVPLNIYFTFFSAVLKASCGKPYTSE